MSKHFSKLVLACLLAPVLAHPLEAADLSNVLTGEPTARDFIEKLSPKPKTRSLARGIRPTVELPIVNFEFDSAALTPQSQVILDQLAEALLAPELQASRFLIEGHTDSVGTERYNQALSERRAASVGAYLATKRIDPSRLNMLGVGEAELLDSVDGKAAINRRVRVINLDG